MYIGTFDLAPETSANVFMSSITDQSSRNRIKYFTHYQNSIFSGCCGRFIAIQTLPTTLQKNWRTLNEKTEQPDLIVMSSH